VSASTAVQRSAYAERYALQVVDASNAACAFEPRLQPGYKVWSFAQPAALPEYAPIVAQSVSLTSPLLTRVSTLPLAREQ